MKALTDKRPALWSAIVELINLRQLEATMGDLAWVSKADAVKRVSKSKRVHDLANQLLVECARIARTQTWFQGQRLPRTELVRTLINAHVVAVHEYDHEAADDVEEYLFEIAHQAVLAETVGA